MTEAVLSEAQREWRRKSMEAQRVRVRAEAAVQKARIEAYHGPGAWCYDRACPCQPPPKQHDVSSSHKPFETWEALHREWCARVMRDAALTIQTQGLRRRWWQR